jgi:beta-galactosidase
MRLPSFLVRLSFALTLCASLHAQRTTLSLNGQWDVQDSVGADDKPQQYGHTAPVPGLAHSAMPVFADVDQFQSRELLSNLLRKGLYTQADYDELGTAKGISHQERNYFWYRRTFTGPRQRAVAVLKVSKAQFGTVVYLNGVRVGEHDPCFTAAWFDVTRAIRWNAPNELVIRIGAHPNVLPANVSEGTDFEKNRWTPGIYDDVKLFAADGPFISNVQVAPQIAKGTALVQTELHNYSDHALATAVRQQVFERKGHAAASAIVTTRVAVAAGATVTVKQTVALRKPHLWSPEDPFLYAVETTTAGDSVETRFGMREFRFDTPTRRAYLNGKPYFLRGSNITLHRFFEDPDVGTLPWDEAWLKRLLVDIPKSMHWNAFRFCIGPVPDRWLEIADENGLLIQNEYMVWVGHNWGTYKPTYDEAEITAEYTEWMRDNWNHPSVAIWDATNESWLPGFTERVIPAVRGLDLSHRAWENSYNAPAGADDPVEDHQYLTQKLSAGAAPSATDFKISDLETMMGPQPNNITYKSGHASILNEYGWLWLNRDGTPTLLTDKLYPRLLGDRNTTENRVALDAYLLGGETEFWRAYRHYAGILHFVYLTSSDPNAFTSDHFLNVKTLQLEPHFERAMRQAMNPLGVYLNFWQTSMAAGSTRDYTVAMVNDEDRTREGTLRLVFKDASGHEAAVQEHSFTLAPVGAESYTFTKPAPSIAGAYSVEAIALPKDAVSEPTISHRDVEIRAK